MFNLQEKLKLIIFLLIVVTIGCAQGIISISYIISCAILFTLSYIASYTNKILLEHLSMKIPLLHASYN